MGRTYLKRQKAVPAEPVTQRDIRRQLAWAAGSEYFQNRDPLWHVTEAFQTSFDQAGRRRTGELLAGPPEKAAGGEEEKGRDLPSLRTFSETAFQRGNLAGAVLQGTGRMMLTSCLKRTAGQSAQTAQQRTLTGLGAKTKRIPGASANQVMFHRGFVNSAVGLVVDVLQDARRTVGLMTQLAQGQGGVGEREGMDTLRSMSPFLDQSPEETLLAQYRRQLQQAEDVQEKALLHSAILRAQALRDKKVQMKEAFTQKLREISDQAVKALREFQDPAFVDSLMADLTKGGADASDGGPADSRPPAGTPEDGGAAGDQDRGDPGDGHAGAAGGGEAGEPAGGDGPAAGP